MADGGNVSAVFYQPPSEGVAECVAIDMLGGPKEFARFWPAKLELDWGWRIHESAVQAWPLDAYAEGYEQARRDIAARLSDKGQQALVDVIADLLALGQ